jgi:hypothetical protein
MSGWRGRSTFFRTLRRVHTALAREWSLLADRPTDERRMLLTRPASLPWPQNWLELSAYQQMVTLALFFETFGMLLASGVDAIRWMPILLNPHAHANLFVGGIECWKVGSEIIRFGDNSCVIKRDEPRGTVRVWRRVLPAYSGPDSSP